MSDENSRAESPRGELALQTIAMPKDTNANGDIFGGWLVSQMDLAAGIASKKISQGRSATVAIKDVTFISPVRVGAMVSCFTEIVKTGTTSISIKVDVWASDINIKAERRMVADGLFVFVAIDDDGKPRKLPE